MDEQKQLSPDEQEKLRLNLIKAQAVRTAMYEVIGESRDEIIKRARAKLTAMGIQLSDAEATGNL